MVKRNYKREYARYHSKPKQKRRRALRNKARRVVTKLRGKAAVRGKDVHHKNSRTMSAKSSNLAITTKAKNRGYRRDRNNRNLGLRTAAKKRRK